RTYRHIGAVCRNRLDQKSQLFGIIAVIAVEKYYYLRIGPNKAKPAQTGRAIAALRLDGDGRAATAGYIRSAIFAAVVGYYNLIDKIFRQLVEHGAYSPLFIERRYNDGYLGPLV